jgi:hypothetical protein
VPEGAENGVLAANGGFDRGGIEHVAPKDLEVRVLDLELRRPPGERSHIVATLESLADELATRATRGADDQDANGALLGGVAIPASTAARLWLRRVSPLAL